MNKQFNIEDKITKIKQTLSQLGNQLQVAEDYRMTDANSMGGSQPLESFLENKFQEKYSQDFSRMSSKLESSRAFVNEYAARSKSPQKTNKEISELYMSARNQMEDKMQDTRESPWDLRIQLDLEKDKNLQLIQRIQQKEELLNEMNRLQNDLYLQINDLQTQCDRLRGKNEDYMQIEVQNANLKKQLERTNSEKLQEIADFKQLENQKMTLIQEIQQMHNQNDQHQRQNQQLTFENKSLQSQVKLQEDNIAHLEEKIRILESQLGQKNSEISNLFESQNSLKATQQEIIHLSAENNQLSLQIEDLKQKLQQKENELTRTHEKLEITRHDLSNINRELNQVQEKFKVETQQLQHELSKKHDKKEINLLRSENEEQRKKLMQMREENENLRLELESRPTLRRVKENEVRVKEIEKQLQQIVTSKHSTSTRHAEKSCEKTPNTSYSKTKSKSKSKSRSKSIPQSSEKSPMRSQTRDNIKRDKDSFQKQVISYQAMKAILEDIQGILSVSSIGDIVPVLKQQKELLKYFNNTKKFVQRTSEMVIECSPPNTFKQTPTLKQIWKWFQRLVYEYMDLKKNIPDWDLYKITLFKIMGNMGVKDVKQIDFKVASMLADNSLLDSIIKKIKILYSIDPTSSYKEVELHVGKLLDSVL